MTEDVANEFALLLLKKTKERKIPWTETALERRFTATIHGELIIRFENRSDRMLELVVMDAKNEELFTVREIYGKADSLARGAPLNELYEMVVNQVKRLDIRIQQSLELLQKL